jgi:indolepyruvate ferredoxin oxidoreductase beta subunit
MFNILLTGVGGQGTVLASKILAQAALTRGWQVRTAETIGMAQRGGSVISHVRMGTAGEQVHAPLIARGQANLIIAFEPGEATRQLAYLRPGGQVVCAQTPVNPVSAALGAVDYNPQQLAAQLAAATSALGGQLTLVDDAFAIKNAGMGDNRKALNTVLLAAASAACALPINTPQLKDAIAACVKPRFIEMNQQVVDLVVERITQICK